MVFTKKRRHAETVVPGRITRRTVGCFHFFIGRLIRVRRDSPCVSSNPTRLSLHGPTTQRHNAENTTPAGGPASPAESARHSPAGSRLLLLSLFHGRVIYKNIFYKSQPVSFFFVVVVVIVVVVGVDSYIYFFGRPYLRGTPF